MANASKQVIAKLYNECLSVTARERLLGDELMKEKEAASAQQQKMVEHNILQREFETDQQLYQSLLQRLRDSALAANFQNFNVRIIDPGSVPLSPVRPNRQRNIAAGLLIGLILGITLAFVQEALDSSVRSAEEAEKLVMLRL